MEGFHWQENFGIGIDSLDIEHQSVLGYLGQLLAALENGKHRESVRFISLALENAVNAHFVHEESLMKMVGYPARGRHLKQHADFFASLRHLLYDFSGETKEDLKAVQHLRKRFLEHILLEDKSYGRFMRTGMQ